MVFIGIIVDKLEEEIFEKEIENNFKKWKIKNTIILINEESIENVKNVKFDTILVNSDVLRKTKLLKVKTDFEECKSISNEFGFRG